MDVSSPTRQPPEPAPGAVPAAPTSRRPLPWPLVGIFAAALLIPALGVGHVFGPAYMGICVSGIVLGLVGTMQGHPLHAAAGGALVLGLAGIRMGTGADPRLLALVLVLAAGWEVWRGGGRSFVVALLALGMVWSGAATSADPATAALIFSVALGLAIAAALALRLHLIPTMPPDGLAAAAYQVLFLAGGILAAATLARAAASEHAIWVIQMFTLRALAPLHVGQRSALIFGAGVLAGALATLGLEHAGLGQAPWSLVVALPALAAGLRSLPLGPPLAPFFFTVAILLVTAPLPADALFRTEAAAVAAVLALLLDSILRPIFLPRHPRQ